MRIRTALAGALVAVLGLASTTTANASMAGNYIEGQTWCALGQHVYIETMVKDKVMAKWTPDPSWDSAYVQSIVFYNSKVKSAARVDLNIQGGTWAIAGVPGEVDWAHAYCAN